MEHGGGNNSTFTTHVVTSSGTDSYSSTSASIGSLKGPRHGGANLKVQNMFTDLKANVKDWESEEEITAYLQKILNKEAFDHAGLIYGMGHAVYTLSDPREVILKRFAQALAEEKGMTDEFKLYDKVEGIAGKLIMDSGLRGYQVGGAQVSEKHCGFVINAGNATAEDVCRLMADVQRIVREKFGVTLEPEVKFLGEF